MKAIFLSAVLFFSTNVFADDSVACEQYAKDAVVGLVKGLGQDVAVQSIKLTDSSAKDGVSQETYQVKLEGKGFTSAETYGVWTIQLNDLGSGCNFSSLSLN